MPSGAGVAPVPPELLGHEGSGGSLGYSRGQQPLPTPGEPWEGFVLICYLDVLIKHSRTEHKFSGGLFFVPTVKKSGGHWESALPELLLTQGFNLPYAYFAFFLLILTSRAYRRIAEYLSLTIVS